MSEESLNSLPTNEYEVSQDPKNNVSQDSVVCNETFSCMY
ncbi:hypothetical protein XA3_02950 [Xylocopilactobacillus apicola]|uniref:Uncharacterized protein n=1 Tax=Xylocopilactobacillus apicola TaxID=2932184 RepID=A0AAU9CV28_9LACO|nr:hypothetical protein XA3_02950 [Xylocopilactobacillus apicola]